MGRLGTSSSQGRKSAPSIGNWTAGAVRNSMTRLDRLEKLVSQLLPKLDLTPEQFFRGGLLRAPATAPTTPKAETGRDEMIPDSGEGVTRGTEKSSANSRPDAVSGEGVTRGTGKSIANSRPDEADGEGVSRGTGKSRANSRRTHGRDGRLEPELATPGPLVEELESRVVALEDKARHTAALLTEVLRYGVVSERAQVQKAAGPLTPSSDAGLDEGSVTPRCTAASVAHSPGTPSSAPGLGEGDQPLTRPAAAAPHGTAGRVEAIESRLTTLETNLAFPPELALVLSQLPQLLASTTSAQQQLMQTSRQHAEAIRNLSSRTPDDTSIERLLGMIETVVQRVKDFEGTIGLHTTELTDIRSSLTSLPAIAELRSLIASVAAVSTDLYDGLRGELHELAHQLRERCASPS